MFKETSPQMNPLKKIDLDLPQDEYKKVEEKAYKVYDLSDEECVANIAPGSVLRSVSGNLFEVNQPIKLNVKPRLKNDYDGMRKAELNGEYFYLMAGFKLPGENEKE
jgi:hypothetical protein